MANVSPLLSNVVRAFTPPALPGFFATPALIPCQPSFDCLPFSVDQPYSGRPISLAQARSGRPWFVSLRSVLLDAVGDPGEGNIVSSGPPTFLLPAAVAKASAFPFALSSLGAYYRIQLLSLHLATSPQLLASDSGGWRSFPGGVSSRTTRDHFQVYGYNRRRSTAGSRRL